MDHDLRSLKDIIGLTPEEFKADTYVPRKWFVRKVNVRNTAGSQFAKWVVENLIVPRSGRHFDFESQVWTSPKSRKKK
jgi:hypothetical protein